MTPGAGQLDFTATNERQTVASTNFPIGIKFMQFTWKFTTIADIITITVSLLF